jgi:hypothetical protein
VPAPAVAIPAGEAAEADIAVRDPLGVTSDNSVPFKDLG